MKKKIEDGADPKDSCDFVFGSTRTVDNFQYLETVWICDGDWCYQQEPRNGMVRNPLRSMLNYNPAMLPLAQSGDYLTADCDGDGVTK